ncbi:MAG: nucleotidyl transferase AbiEii/AbiGii toxin family protein [Pseudomonadota bacterium]
MSIPFPEIINLDSIFVWLMHRISEEFGDHAILKGGIELRLLNCPRSTNDIDYIFVPYSSKKEITEGLDKILKEIPNAEIFQTMNSKAVRIKIHVEGVSIQIEASVSKECKAIAMSTNVLAGHVNQLGRIVSVMSLDVALSHKLAAWNERRLMRDLYDIYYLFDVVGEKPDMETLNNRLKKVESRLPKLKKVKNMTLEEFISELSDAAKNLTDEAVRKELSPLLDETELVGLDKKLKAALNKLVEFLSSIKK